MLLARIIWLTCTPLMALALLPHLPPEYSAPPPPARWLKHTFKCMWISIKCKALTCMSWWNSSYLFYESKSTSSASSSFFFLLSGMRSSSQLSSLLVNIQSISFLMNTSANTCRSDTQEQNVTKIWLKEHTVQKRKMDLNEHEADNSESMRDKAV